MWRVKREFLDGTLHSKSRLGLLTLKHISAIRVTTKTNADCTVICLIGDSTAACGLVPGQVR